MKVTDELIKKAEDLAKEFRVKFSPQSKPKMVSLNPHKQINVAMLERLFNRFGITPAQMYPTGLHEMIDAPCEGWVRRSWYRCRGVYGNNFKVR